MVCPLCEKDPSFFKVFREKLRYDIPRKVFKCLHCGLIFLDQKEKNLQEFYQKDYRKLYSPILGKEVSPEEMFAIHLPFSENRLEKIRHFLSPSLRVLEIGSSAGQFLYTLRSYVKECIGIEFDEVFAEFTEKKFGLKVYTEPLEKTNLEKGSFDLICALEVFEHIEEPLTFLNSISQYLKPNGMIYFEVPNHNDSLLSVFDVPAYRDFYYREPHSFYYTPTTLKAIMQKGGFEGSVSWSGFEPNMINQLHWILVNRPQSTASEVYGPLRLPFGENTSGEIRKDFMEFITHLHNQYREFLNTHLLCSHIVFIGRKGE